MMKLRAGWIWLMFCVVGQGAELDLEFSGYRSSEQPEGFQSLSAGSGKPGRWEIVMDAVPPLLAPMNPLAPQVTKRAVLAQTARIPTDEHFPLFIYQGEEFDDFTLTTRFKIVEGIFAQMAGIAFRIKDEKNYYVIRASSKDRTLRFYKVINGLRGALIGPEIDIPLKEWHDLKIQCEGNTIRCWFNGKEEIPMINDTSLVAGKIGFWTKSDSVSYFADTRIQYKARVPKAQSILEATMKKYGRLKGLWVFGTSPDNPTVRLLASHDGEDMGEPGGEVEQKVYDKGVKFYGKNRKTVTVTVPARDRNGDPIAAVRIEMESFPGQTQNNALARTIPIIRYMEGLIGPADTLAE